jgi:TRAP-type mannitol/chloroaromatic compound transport system substrate-binding protein
LPDDLKGILQYGVEAASTANTARAMNEYSADLVALQKDHGVKVERTSKDILDAQLKAWDEIIPTLEADPFMKKTIQSQREWVERVSYYELMNAPDYALAYNHYFPGKLKL